MPRIDINTPSQDEDLDISNDTIASETAQPVTETKTISDFSEVNPVVGSDDEDGDSSVDDSETTPVETAPTAPVVTETPDQPTSGGGKIPRPTGRIFLEVVLAFLIVGLALWAWSLKIDNNTLNKQVNDLTKQVTALQSNPLLVAEGKQNKILAAVGRLTVLPTGEVPTISEVTDATAVKKSVPDLKDVQNGDKILFYLKSGQIIQYRPSTDKVVLNQRFTVNK
jgi:hypothetical protein